MLLYVLKLNQNAKMPEAYGKYYAYPVITRISPIQRPHYIPSSYTYQFFEKSYSCIVFRVKDC